jgi:thioesterase domain-containing protein
MGGLIALEMSQQFRAMGDEVELLFLLDPMLPTGELVKGLVAAGGSSAKSGLWTVVSARARRILNGPATEGWGRWLSLFAPLPLPLSRLTPVGLLSGWTNHVLTNWHLRQPSELSGLLFPKNRWPGIWFAAKPLVRGYRPRPYEGRVFAAFADEGRRSAWGEFVPRAEVQALPLGHGDVFKAPVMDQWAPRLAACLQNAPAPP